MTIFFGKRAASLIAISATALFMQGNISIAQDSDAIRAKCIDQAVASFPGTSPEGPESRARVEVYIVCMRQHGLTP
jgi:hypothetical protein